MKLNLSPTVFGVIAAVASVAMGSNAHADDWKSIPGAACQAYFGSEERHIDKRADGAYNRDTLDRWVSCLNVRDHVSNTNGTSGEWIYVVQAPNQATICFNRSATPSGGDVHTVSSRRTGLGWLFIDTANSASFGPYVIYCRLPPAARISTILLREFADTNTN
jgi:hypothetical protein